MTSALTPSAFIAVAIGAVLGAWARWLLSLALNSAWSAVPLGTLIANVVGGYMVGMAVAYFASVPTLAPEWRLFAITGFLGALTTFSTFSAESMNLLQAEQHGAALLHSAFHLLGSLAATFAGFATVRALLRVVAG